MRDTNFATNSQIMREVLHEVTIDLSLGRTQQRDHNTVLGELAKRLKERYGIAIQSFRIEPRDTTYLAVEASEGDTTRGRIIVSHFANTLWIAKRKHFASWNIPL